MEDGEGLAATARLSQASQDTGVPHTPSSDDDLQKACRKGVEKLIQSVKGTLSKVTEIQKRVNGDQPWGKVKLPEFVGWFIWPNGEIQGLTTGMWRSGAC